jgi:hypothetical protein
MPTRFVDPDLLRRACDLLSPPGATPKQYLRWRELARLTGMGEHWIRKRYQGRDRSELEVTSIERLRKALEAKHRQTPDPALREIGELLAAADSRPPTERLAPPRAYYPREPLRVRVVNVGFIRSSRANYCQRLEAGIRSGLLGGLRLSHLIDDESVDLGAATTEAARLAALRGLLRQFNDDPRYVERTYLVPIGTVATTAVARLLERDRGVRQRLGRDLRVIFAGVTDPAITGIGQFSRDYVGGMYAGSTFADRMQFIADAFPGWKMAFIYDPRLPQELVARDQVAQWSGGSVEPVAVDLRRPTRLASDVQRCLVAGYTVISQAIGELIRDHPQTPFIGGGTGDLGRGAVLSTGNHDLLFGMECAARLIVPDCRNEINLRDMDILRPDPVYGINLKACGRYGLIATVAARNRCRVIVD